MLIFVWVLNALALLLVSEILPGFAIDGFGRALVVALVLGLVNVIIRPLLLIITLPINLLTLGLFTFVINGLMLWLVQAIVKGVSIDTFTTAITAAVLLWVASFLTQIIVSTFMQRRG